MVDWDDDDEHNHRDDICLDHFSLGPGTLKDKQARLERFVAKLVNEDSSRYFWDEILDGIHRVRDRENKQKSSR